MTDAAPAAIKTWVARQLGTAAVPVVAWAAADAGGVTVLVHADGYAASRVRHSDLSDDGLVVLRERVAAPGPLCAQDALAALRAPPFATRAVGISAVSAPYAAELHRVVGSGAEVWSDGEGHVERVSAAPAAWRAFSLSAV